MSKLTVREESLFAELLLQPVSRRSAFLDEACGNDRPLRARMEALLAAHEIPGSVLSPIVLHRDAAGQREEKPGDRFGRYKLLLKLGEGGCGLVFMAEQEEPVRRRVALKIIKAGMDTREVIARFEAERQALAMMDHPGICKVLDAGATETGRPFFVMELVRGVPITRYCDENQLPTRARLELFMQVCHAVQHAHQKGIIHRDLKPSNILVTLHGTAAAPKVIDFGIAKATQGRLTDATLVTAFEQFLGTPAYMSPEQAEMSGLDIDTRTDVYSLGVLLYELLTGRPPFDPKSLMVASRDELRRIIREVEPPKPSTHLSTLAESDRSTVAQRRGTDPAKLRVLLAGDLDWIAMKALEKHRARRYDTPVALADDIARHLRHEPVVARPPGKLYRMHKFARRHRVGVVAGGFTGGIFLAGTVVSLWEAVRATRAEHVAQEEGSRAVAARTRADRLLDFMLGDLRTEVQKVGKLDLIDMVGDKATAYFASLEPRELTDSTLLQQTRTLRQIGDNRIEQARYFEAERAFATAYHRAAALVARHPKNGDMLFERAQAEFGLGTVYLRQGESSQAAEWMTRYRDSSLVLAQIEPDNFRSQQEVAFGHQNLAAIEMDRGNLDAARAGFLAKLAACQAMVAKRPGDPQLLASLADVHSWLGSLAERSGDLIGADERFSAQAAQLDAVLRIDPRSAEWRHLLADSLTFRASVLSILGQRARANDLLGRARGMLDALVAQDPNNLNWLLTAMNLRLQAAMLSLADGRHNDAGREIEIARDKLQRVVAAEPSARAFTGRLATAWRLEASLRRIVGHGDPMTAVVKAFELGEPLIRQARADDRILGEFGQTCVVASRIAWERGERDDAIRYARRALELLGPRTARSHDWRLCDPAARALALLGLQAESQALIDRLNSSGYQPLEPWPQTVAFISLPASKSNPIPP